MHITFEYTVDDQVELYLDSMSRMPSVRSRRRRDQFLTSLAIAAVLFVLLPPGSDLRLLIPVAGAIAWWYIYPRIWTWRVVRQLRTTFRRTMQGDGPFLCEVSLGPEGVRVRQLGQEILYPWEDVASIEDQGDGIDITTTDNGGVVVWKRAFASAADQAKFMELAESYRVTPPDEPPAPAGS